MRMKCLRIFPETCPRISLSLPSSFSLNMALGSAVITTASTSIGSLLGIQQFSKPAIVFHIRRAYKASFPAFWAQCGVPEEAKKCQTGDEIRWACSCERGHHGLREDFRKSTRKVPV